MEQCGREILGTNRYGRKKKGWGEDRRCGGGQNQPKLNMYENPMWELPCKLI